MLRARKDIHLPSGLDLFFVGCPRSSQEPVLHGSDSNRDEIERSGDGGLHIDNAAVYIRPTIVYDCDHGCTAEADFDTRAQRYVEHGDAHGGLRDRLAACGDASHEAVADAVV